MNSVLVSTAVAAFLAATAAAAGGYVAPIVAVEPVAVAPVAQATRDWTGFYGGLQFGRVGIEGGPWCALKPNSSGKLPNFCLLDESGKQYGVHLGYLHDFGRFVGGAELSYDKLKVDDIDIWDGSPLQTADGDLIRAKLLAGLDAGRFLPYAAVGIARADFDFAGDSGDDTAFGYGAGIKFMASERFLIGAEWMTHEFETITGDADIDTFALSASYRF